ncbi:hypothetical protein ACP4OV_008557 [Aristida adscensionis]
MAAEAPPRSGGERLRLLCSHGGRFLPRGPAGALRYVGGETRALALPRAATFRDLAARLAEVAGGAEVRGVRHRLADEELEDVLVSVTCDEELAHMRDEYDRLRATRPAASFRVFVSTTGGDSGGGGVQRRGAAATGLPPRPPAPAMRRVQSDQEVTARAYLHRRLAPPAPVRRVQSAQEFAGRCHLTPSFHHHRRREQCGCFCHRRGQPSMSKNAKIGVRLGVQEAAPAVTTAKATVWVAYRDAATQKARSRDAEAAKEQQRAIWEFE